MLVADEMSDNVSSRGATTRVAKPLLASNTADDREWLANPAIAENESTRIKGTVRKQSNRLLWVLGFFFFKTGGARLNEKQ